jgi:hypothetical protein
MIFGEEYSIVMKCLKKTKPRFYVLPDKSQHSIPVYDMKAYGGRWGIASLILSLVKVTLLPH